MKKLTYCTLALVVLSFSTISAMKANIVTNRSNIHLTIGEDVYNLSLSKSKDFRKECNGYSIILKEKEETNNIKMKLSDKGNNIMKLLLTKSGDVYLYKTNWNSSLDISCNGTLNLLSYLNLSPKKKDPRKTFSCNRFEGKGNDVYIWGDVYVQNYWSFKGDTVCIAGRFRNKGANDVLNTPSREQADNLKKNYLSKLSRGFWVLGTTDVSSIMTHNLNTHIVGTLQSPSLSQKGYARELSVGRGNFTDEFFADFNACYSTEQKKEALTQFSTEKLSGAEKVTVNVKENTKVKIDNMDCRPEIIFEGNPNLEGTRKGREISIKYNETFEVNIKNIDDRITISGVKLKVVQKKIEPSPKVGLKPSQEINEPWGIKNIGNTCFANAAFQLILSSENMRNIYLSYNGNDAFMKAMKALVTMWIERKDVTSPINIQALVEHIWPDGFKKNDEATGKQDSEKKGEVDRQQHDSGEFLLHLLGKTEEVVGGSLPFIGKQTSHITGEKEEQLSKEEEKFNSVVLGIEEIKKSSDLKTLVLSTSEEISDYNIEGTKTKVKKIIERTFIPKCLFINIGRRTYHKDDGGVLHYRNDTTSINIPEVFTLDDSNGVDYALKGFVRYSGNEKGTGGHYFAYTNFQNTWFCANDEEIKTAEEKSEEMKEILECYEFKYNDENENNINDTSSTILLYEEVEKAPSKK